MSSQTSRGGYEFILHVRGVGIVSTKDRLYFQKIVHSSTSSPEDTPPERSGVYFPTP